MDLGGRKGRSASIVYCSHWYSLALTFLTTLGKSFPHSKSWLTACRRGTMNFCWWILEAFTDSSKQNKVGGGRGGEESMPGYFKKPKVKAIIGINTLFYWLIYDVVWKDLQALAAHKYSISRGSMGSAWLRFFDCLFSFLTGDVFLLTRVYTTNNRNT